MTKLEQTIQDLQLALYDYNRNRKLINLSSVLYYAKLLYKLGRK